MAINFDKAHEIDEDGLAITDSNGTALSYFTSGVGDPTGTAAPINTWYFRNDNRLLYYKFGSGNGDWRQIQSDDITFDPTGLLNFDPADDTVHKALTRFGGFSVADLTEAEGTVATAQVTTTSNGWVSRSGYPFLTANVKTAGQFSIRWSTEVGQSTKNRNYGLRLRWRPEGGAWTVISSVELSNSRDNNFIMQGGFQQVTLATDSRIEVDMQYGQTTGGGSALIQNSSMEIRRIGD